MKNDQTRRQLHLTRETLRTLSEDNLTRVAGGNGDSAGLLCVFSVLLICGDSTVCSVLAGSCDERGGDS
jgi:hypothetical protein